MKIQSEIIGTASKMGIVDYIAQFDKKRERKNREFYFSSESGLQL
ncbi:hypothetical protein QOZ95_004530 [Paenibacillus brasilensis]|uniref:Uncharacterized protein n=1 Tax=Paenibacillus brasilensis TaxID=128574 RepID=A0ABU0L521_9BACL|nr:hypothetical protein [Paenibacillus brasilensis]